MCRLFAFSFTKETRLAEKIDAVHAFRLLSLSGSVPRTITPGHGDGWGIAVYGEGENVPHVYKSILSSADDADTTPLSFFTEGRAESGLAHLRKKTVGENALENTHPFIEGRFSFIHNGTIAKGDGPYPQLASTCEGNTDSERLFRKFLENVNAGNSPQEAYLAMLRETCARYTSLSALNTILHDGTHLYVSRIMNIDYPQYKDLDLENYYTLYVGKNARGDVLVSSEKISFEGLDYTLLQNNSVCVIDLTTGTHSMIEL